jgi:hypothetical protein
MTAIFYPFEIFRLLNSLATAFYVQNTVHAVIRDATRPQAPKTRSFVDFNEIGL